MPIFLFLLKYYTNEDILKDYLITAIKQTKALEKIFWTFSSEHLRVHCELSLLQSVGIHVVEAERCS